MVDTNVTTPAPRKRRRWLRVLGLIFGVLIVLVIVAYFVGTSSAFFKGVILPKASAALNASITVSDASISPFHEVVLKNLKVQTSGSEPLVTAPEVRLRYSLMDIIGGNIHVDEVTLSSPTVTLVENPDKTSNLDPILKAFQGKPAQPAQPAKSSKPMNVDVRKISLTEATLRQIKLYAAGEHRDLAELTHVNVTVDSIKNGQTGKLDLSAEISVQNNPPAPGTNGLLHAKLEGSLSLALTADLKPGAIQGTTKLEVTRAEGALAQAAGFVANFDCNVTPTDIKQVALRFAKGGTPLGELVVKGPYDIAGSEGRLTISLVNIDKNLLNIAGGGSGLDFGPTTINSTNVVELAKAGKSVTASGQFNLNKFQVTRANQTTPALELHADYNVTVDTAASTAVLRSLTITGTQKGNQLVRGELANPMTFAWGTTANAVGDSTLSLAVTHLDLADWKPFLGEVAPAGDVNVKLQLVSKQAGKQLGFDVSSEIDNLTAGAGSNRITQATVTLTLRGQATDMKQFSFPEYKLGLARQNQPLVSVSGSGTYDQAAGNADLQLDAQVMLARLLQALPRPDLDVSSGTAELKAHITQKGKNQDVTGNLALADFTGKVGSNAFNKFGMTADLDVGMTPQDVQIRKIAGKLTQGGDAGGDFSVSGKYLTNQSVQLTLKLADFNQNGLRPFLESALAGKTLTSIALNADASVQYDPQAASSVKADMQITNLVVRDPTGQFPATPLAAGIQVDASLNKQVADIRQFQIALTSTALATNQVQLTGHIDMSNTNATQGNVKLAADSLDLTSYYDLFGGQQKAAGQSAAPATPQQPSAASAPPGPEQEPPAKKLPLQNFTAEASVGRLYLHEVVLTNFQAVTKIDGGHVVVNPFKLWVNGAPMNMLVDVDLGVPGYKYDCSFNADAVPLAPLVNTFQPERKGQLSGTFTAVAKITGAGTTGASMQKNLQGNFDVGSTNLNLSVANVHNKVLKLLVKVVTMIPELAKNPESAISSFAGSLTSGGGTGKTGGLSSDMEKSPIDQIVAKGTIGSGQVVLESALVQSPAFQAKANGTITLAPILTNSTLQIPVAIALSRPVAERINLVPANTPTNALYAALPDFLTVRGTAGEPKQDINKVALAGTLVKGIGGLIPGAAGGGKTGSILQGVGNLLGGNASPATNAPGTSAPATNQNPVNNLLKGLFK
ncbi:MAG TPA: AsmA family protein [Candidatus Acidoferrum sp.]|jgi:hypothetical protein|nr:AsmA family protein [Candidatus Acidoferrum sp.]